MGDRQALAAFWREFDDAFQPSTARADVRAAAARVNSYATPSLMASWRVMCRSTQDGDPYATSFAAFIDFAAGYAAEIRLLAAEQLRVMDKHFPGDPASLLEAFILFGSGTLKSPSRGDQHVMEGTEPLSAKQQFTIWFSFTRAASRHAADRERWNRVAAYVGLACECHLLLLPKTAGNTSELGGDAVRSLVAAWQAEDPDPIDEQRLDMRLWRLVRK